MTEVIGVRFRGGCKEYYFDPHGITVEPNQFVIVETAQGLEYAQCVSGNHEVEDDSVVQPLRPLVRVATENDDRTYAYNKTREKNAFEVCQKKIAERGLDMKLVRVESNFDGSKIIFFFTSDGRVDFRELVRDLAGVFRARIELRQIGVRDEAKMLGGLGICGRPFCCSQFLDDFVPVSIKMAKTQNLSLNPTKISGTCGRLMCCLKYEQNAYEDAVRRCPKQDSFVATPDGLGNVSSVDILREQVLVRLDGQNESPKRYRTCEIHVLRNGKGSRDGIELPTTLPERYQEPPEEEPQLTLNFFSSAKPIVPPEQWTAPVAKADAPATDEEEKEKRRSRRGGRGHRGGRGRGKGSGEGGEKSAAPKSENTPQKGGDKPTEKRSEANAPRAAISRAANVRPAIPTRTASAVPRARASRTVKLPTRRKPRVRPARRKPRARLRAARTSRAAAATAAAEAAAEVAVRAAKPPRRRTKRKQEIEPPRSTVVSRRFCQKAERNCFHAVPCLPHRRSHRPHAARLQPWPPARLFFEETGKCTGLSEQCR